MAKPIVCGPEGEQVYLILYGTGVRHGGSVSASVNGVSVPAVLAPQPQYPGLDQVNLLLHRGLAGAGTVTIVVSVDGQAANAVTTTVM